MKFIKFSLWMSAFGTLVFLGLNFSSPDKNSEVRNLMMKQKLTGRGQPAPAQKRYVRIEGKYYEYNPKHVYNVNGVSTYYKASKHELAEPAGLQQQVQQAAHQAGVQGNVNAQPSHNPQALEKVRRMAESGPLSVYSPGGAQAIIDGANEAREKAEERNRALNQLMNE